MQSSFSPCVSGVLPDRQVVDAAVEVARERLHDRPPMKEVFCGLDEVPRAVQQKARNLECLLLRWKAGEDPDTLRDELGLRVTIEQLPRLWARYERAGCRWEALIDGRYGHPQKANSAVRGWLIERKQDNPELTGPELSTELEQLWGTDLTSGYVNTLLRRQGLTRGRGRPGPRASREPQAAPEVVTEVVANAGLFFLEAAKQEMGVVPIVEQCLAQAGELRAAEAAEPAPRVVRSEAATNWQKLDHLLYLPVLGLQRPRDLLHYQGPGLKALYGFTYKYQPLEHFLGEVASLRMGEALAWALGGCYSQAWYPGEGSLVLYVDWHTKAHWTKFAAHCMKVAMLGRVMPGSKQLMVNGADGHLLLGLDRAADSHFLHVLVDLEEEIERRLGRRVALTIVDSEAGGLNIAERYAAAGRHYLSVLFGEHDHTLDEFTLLGEWEGVEGDEEHEAVDARWSDEKKAAQEPRRLVLMRRAGGSELSRVYAGRIPEGILAKSVPGLHRGRWVNQELRIQELVAGANLNANYGYQYAQVLNRTEQRRYEEACERVETSRRRLAAHEGVLGDLRRKLATQCEGQRATEAALQQEIGAAAAALEEREGAGGDGPRGRRRLGNLQEQLAKARARADREQTGTKRKIEQRQAQRDKAAKETAQRQAVLDAMSPESLCRERDLQKDQIMLDLQVLLGSLHHWACEHYFAPELERLQLETATRMIYQKPGQITWRPGEVEVMLERYRYADQQEAMFETCRRFNEKSIRWRDGRLIRIRVQGGPRFQ